MEKSTCENCGQKTDRNHRRRGFAAAKLETLAENSRKRSSKKEELYFFCGGLGGVMESRSIRKQSRKEE